MELPKNLSRNKTALAVGAAVAALVTAGALAMVVWPALTRPDPPAEATGDAGLRIRVVEPPKAPVSRSSPLDVGLSETDQALVRSREALFVGTPPAGATPPAAPRYAPMRIPRTDEDDTALPPADDQWERGRVESGFELAQQLREQERLARRERERREAWEDAQRERRWEEERERDRDDDRRPDDRYDPPPPPSDEPLPPEPR